MSDDTREIPATRRQASPALCRLAVLLLGSACVLPQIGLSIADRPVSVPLLSTGVALIGVALGSKAAERHER